MYLSSTTTMVMIQAMAWYRKHLHDWDYFVTLTGNDYPIMPMRNIEKIMKIQNPKLPFLMVWTSGVSKFLNRMYTQYPVYEKDAKLKVLYMYLFATSCIFFYFFLCCFAAIDSHTTQRSWESNRSCCKPSACKSVCVHNV